MLQDICAPISLGELIDKIIILQIKVQYFQGSALENVNNELNVLESILRDLKLSICPTLIHSLREVNRKLWNTEVDIRAQEQANSFGDDFIRLARSVYQLNDRRATIKYEINTIYGSSLVEEKSYHSYSSAI